VAAKKGEAIARFKPRLFYGWYLVAASWIMTFLITGTAVSIFFKPILDEFGWNRATLSLISAISILFFAFLSPFLGRLIDHFGPRIMLLATIIAQTLSSLFHGLATGMVSICIARFLYVLKPMQGTQVLINRWFVKERGKALGILSSSSSLGTLLLSPVSQYLILYWGWRYTFLFWAGVTAVVTLPLLLLIRDKPEDMGLHPDGEIQENIMHLRSSSQLRVNGIDGSVNTDAGQNLKEVVIRRPFWLLSATQFICGIGCGLMMTHTVIFATDLGHSAIIGASFLSIQGGFSLLGVLITGPMSDRMARHKVLALTHFIRSISFLIMIFAVVYSGGSLWILFSSMALFGFGWFATANLTAGLVADLFGNLRMGTILGIVMTSHTVGFAIGSYAGGITYQITGSYLLIFIIQGLLEFTAASFAFTIRRN